MKVILKKKNKRQHSSSSESEEKSKIMKKKSCSKKKIHSSRHKQSKSKERSSSSDSSSSVDSSTSSSSDTSSSSTTSEDERKRRKKLKKERLKKSKTQKVNREMEDGPSNDIPIELMGEDRSMVPMTKEEWEKKQNVIRRVYDETTGRNRLIKGDGEVIEEIVSRERHKQINQEATRGDGEYFQKHSKKL